MDFVKHHAPGEMGENSRTNIKRDVTRATVDRDHSTRQQFDNVFLQWRIPETVRCDGCHTATGFVGAEAANRPAAAGRGDLPSGR